MNNTERSAIAQAVNDSVHYNMIAHVTVDTVDQDVCTYTSYIQSKGHEVDGTAEVVHHGAVSYDIWGITEDGDEFRIVVK